MSEVIVNKVERVKQLLMVEKRACDMHKEDYLRLQKELAVEQQKVNSLVTGQARLKKEHQFWLDRVRAQEDEACSQSKALEALRIQRTSLLKEINFAKIEKQELEDSIRADESIVAGLERAANHLTDQIEITILNRENLQSEVQRQKEAMLQTDEEMEEVQRRMAAMHAMALSSLHASGVLNPLTPHPPPV